MSGNAAAKAKLWGTPVPEGLKHGVNTYAYRVYGCPCPVCVPAGRRRKMRPGGTPAVERNRKHRRGKRGKPVPPNVQHGMYAYTVYGCRCEICGAARSAQRAQWRDAWRKRATGVWRTERGKEIIHWPPTGSGLWTCPDCGEQFIRRPAPQREEQTRAT